MNLEKVKTITNLFREKEKDPRCSAVIVAAGSSERMGNDKLTAALGGIPVLARTLRAFEACPRDHRRHPCRPHRGDGRPVQEL